MDIDKSKHTVETHCKCGNFLPQDTTCESVIADPQTSQTNGNHIIQQESAEQCWKTSMIIQQKDPNVLKVFLIKRIGDEQGTIIAINMIKILNEFKVQVFVEENVTDELNSKDTEKNAVYSPYKEEEEQNIDLLIIIGGDGSILWALQYFHHRITPPILAYSKGTLNYLCNFSIQNYEKSLKSILESIFAKKSVLVEMRSRLHCEIINKETGKTRTLEALNEISLDRGCNPNIVKLNCYLEGKYFATFEGDGVLVATPTGSTAYQLSAGGPILNHLMNSFAVTPISSLNLSTRPVVLPSKVKLTFKVHPDSRRSSFLGADGQIKLEITKDNEVLVTGSKFYAPCKIEFAIEVKEYLVILGENQDTLDNWITRLRDLLGWNRKYL